LFCLALICTGGSSSELNVLTAGGVITAYAGPGPARAYDSGPHR